MEIAQSVERFFKHRRNLLLTSAVAIFIYMSGASISELNVLGMKLQTVKHESILRILTYVLLYMIIKYLQFIYAMRGTRIKSDVELKMRLRVREVGLVEYKSQYKNYSNFELQNIEYNGKKGLFLWEVRYLDRDSDGELQNEISKALMGPIILGFKKLWKIYFFEYCSYIIKTPWFGEYVLPLLAGVYAVIVLNL